MATRRKALAIANGKGGVGKTTLSANLSVQWASKRRHVLAVDLDAQGNLATALGLGVVQPAPPPAVVPTGRPGLSYAAWQLPAASAAAAQALMAGFDGAGCDIAVMDTPPSASSPQADAALAVARWLMIPIRCDRHSLDGIATVLRRALSAGDERIDPLCVALFGVNPRATRMLRDTREELRELLGGHMDVLQTTIRSAERAQVDALEAGITAGEYATAATHHRASRPARNAASLADDYTALAKEIDRLITTRERRDKTSGGPAR